MEKFANMHSKLASSSILQSPYEDAITEPYRYVTENPGKGVVPTIINACNPWLNVPKEQLELIIKAATVLHHTCLM
jgi:geranylgeranyl diphosphate synthase type 3